MNPPDFQQADAAFPTLRILRKVPLQMVNFVSGLQSFPSFHYKVIFLWLNVLWRVQQSDCMHVCVYTEQHSHSPPLGAHVDINVFFSLSI